MIFLGEHHSIINRIWNTMMIRLRRVKRYLPRAILHASKHLILDLVRVPPNRNTSTKYHNALAMSSVNSRNEDLTVHIPGSNRPQGEFHINRVFNIKSMLIAVISMKKILWQLETVTGKGQGFLQQI